MTEPVRSTTVEAEDGRAAVGVLWATALGLPVWAAAIGVIRALLA